jgi:hypothetical protein
MAILSPERDPEHGAPGTYPDPITELRGVALHEYPHATIFKDCQTGFVVPQRNKYEWPFCPVGYCCGHAPMMLFKYR